MHEYLVAYFNMSTNQQDFLNVDGASEREAVYEATEKVLGTDAIGVALSMKELQDHCFECDIQFVFQKI